MDSDSTFGALHNASISSEKYNNEDDFITKLLGFDEKCNSAVSEATQLSGACRMNIEPKQNSLNSSGQYEEISKLLNGPNFAQTFEELMLVKKEAGVLHEKLERSEKEKANLRLQVDVLMAENYQMKYLKKQHDEVKEKVNELQEDLSNRLMAYQKLKKEAKSSCAQLSETRKAVRKMQKDKKILWDLYKQFAQKLETADLLSMKEKNIIKKSEEQNALDSEEAFDSEEQEKIFLSALSYGVQQKPKTLTNIQWKHCNKVFSKVFSFEGVNIGKKLPYIKNAIEDKCLNGAPYESGYMLIGPLVIYARVKGWIWAQKHLLENYIHPNLQAYSGKENGERGFAFFANLCADICYGCPGEVMSLSWLMNYIKTPCEREFVQINAGTALLKLISLRKEVLTNEIEEWISQFYGDPRVTEFCSLYFKLRLMEDQDLVLENDIF